MIVNPQSKLKPPFNNQGDQEKYWAQQLFLEEYKKYKFKKYKGNIKISGNEILLDNQACVELFVENDFYGIFSNGIIYPNQFGTTKILVKYISELTFLSDLPQVRRFYCYIQKHDSLTKQPTAYVFELTNSQGDSEMSLQEFINGASLTFLREGWLVT